MKHTFLPIILDMRVKLFAPKNKNAQTMCVISRCCVQWLLWFMKYCIFYHHSMYVLTKKVCQLWRKSLHSQECCFRMPINIHRKNSPVRLIVQTFNCEKMSIIILYLQNAIILMDGFIFVIYYWRHHGDWDFKYISIFFMCLGPLWNKLLSWLRT